mgnify:FL=1
MFSHGDDDDDDKDSAIRAAWLAFREASVLREVEHRNIVRLEELLPVTTLVGSSGIEKSVSAIVMEHAPYGTLFDLMN